MTDVSIQAQDETGALHFGAAPRRLAPIALDAMSPAQKQVAQALIESPRRGVRGPFHALLRNPHLAERVRMLGECIRFEAQIALDLREFAILIVARHWCAHYEWHAHSHAAAQAGVPREVIEAIGEARIPVGMSQDQALIYTFLQELLTNKDVSDAAYDALLARMGEQGLLEVLSTAAYFGFVSMILNAVRHPVPEGGTPLPALEP